MKIGTISDLIAYRHKHDNLVREVRHETVTSSHGGEWDMRIFADQISGTEHVVLSKGDITDGKPVLARTHALNALEDVLGIGLAASPGKPTGKLPRAMNIIAREGRGAVFLFRQPRPSLASEMEDDDTPRTIKQTGLGAQIMSTMGLHELILLTDSPNTRYLGLDAYGITIVRHPPAQRRITPWPGTEYTLPRATFDKPVKLLIVVAPSTAISRDMMIEGAKAEIEASGATCDLIEVPGALEIPTAIGIAERLSNFDGYVAPRLRHPRRHYAL